MPLREILYGLLMADPNVIGRSLDFDGETCTVRAVMPRSFRFYPQRADLWLFLDPCQPWLPSCSRRNVTCVSPLPARAGCASGGRGACGSRSS
ncbi:hypothetical protein SBA4_3020012 [Candidatus Sulfopaludibacter sp. SbA4]|nr:hypothetical protein SBA4_3020012 [Candidatus Sulfopaludibacter sp. SbA4]